MEKKAQMGMMVALAIGIIMMVVIFGVITVFIDDIALNLITVDNETITITSTLDNTTSINESITIAAGVGATGNISVINVTYFGNSTNNSDIGQVLIGQDVNWTIGGVITVVQGEFGAGVYNITYTRSTNGVGTAVENADIDSTTFFGDDTTSTEDTGIAFNTEVNITTGGSVTVTTINFTDGVYNLSYQYRPNAYLTSGTTRTLVSTIPILLAVVMLIFLVGFITTKV